MKSKLTVLWLVIVIFTTITNAQVTLFDGSVTSIAPINNSIGQSIVPTFNGTITGAVNANTQLQISTDNFSTTLYTITSASTPALTFPYNLALSSIQLQNGVTYYWRVVQTLPAYTGTTYSFTTVSSAMPYLSYPYNGTILSGYYTTFSWQTSVAGLSYTIQIAPSSDPTFATPAGFILNTASTNNYYSVDNSIFTQGSTYYWRVIATNLAGTVVYNYSNIFQFSMPGLPDVIGSYPTGGVAIYSNPPTLYWYPFAFNPKVTDYVVRIKKGSAPTQTALSALPLSTAVSEWVFRTTSVNTFVTVPIALEAGATYYWDVSSYDGVSTLNAAFYTANASVVNSFSVYGTITFITCYPTFPASGITVTSTPTFYWYANLYAPVLYYQLQIDSDADFSGGHQVDHTTAIPTNSYTITSGEAATLTAGTTYYWRVRGSFDGATYGPWSSGASFVYPSSSSTAASVATPYPTSPTFGSVVTVTNPTLIWSVFSTDPLQFKVRWATDPTLSGGTFATPLGTTPWISSNSFVLAGLTPGATYYWQVQARIATTLSEGAWSSIGWFSTDAGAAAVVPIAGSPVNGTSINDTKATLSWILPTQSSSVLKYDVQYSKQSNFSDAKTINNVDKANVNINDLDKNSVYFWRVLSKTNTGFVSSYSAATSFNTGNVTSVQDVEIPNQFELAQNYPNPFNPSTVISYSLPENSFVVIKIFDMLGREIKTLINGEIAAGKHSINWNGDDNFGKKVSAGAYLYRMSSGTFNEVKKMLLVK